jgi:hypothetical protein
MKDEVNALAAGTDNASEFPRPARRSIQQTETAIGFSSADLPSVKKLNIYSKRSAVPLGGKRSGTSSGATPIRLLAIPK